MHVGLRQLMGKREDQKFDKMPFELKQTMNARSAR